MPMFNMNLPITRNYPERRKDREESWFRQVGLKRKIMVTDDIVGLFASPIDKIL